MKLLLENWRQYLIETQEKQGVSSSEAISALENVLGGTRHDGSGFKKGFEGIIDEDEDNIGNSDSLSEILSKINAASITKVLEEYSKGMFETSIDMSQITSPIEVAILNSILLFTAGNVATVRSPEKFDPEQAKDVESPKGGGFHYGNRAATYILNNAPYLLKPTKELYSIANHVIKVMSSMPNPQGSTAIYRGVGLPRQVFDGLEEGLLFNPGGAAGLVSSWSTDSQIAYNYACGSPGQPREQYFENLKKRWVCCKFIIKSCEKGAFMGNISGYRGEDEFLLSVPVKIEKIKVTGDMGDVYRQPNEEGEFVGLPEGQRIKAEIICDEVAG